MIFCIGTTPAVQRVMLFRGLTLDTVNRAAATLDGAAGKSVNVAKVLRLLGEQVLATGFLGGDRGEYLRGILQSKGMELEFVTVTSDTRLCITVIDQSTGTHTELVEEGKPVSADEYARLLEIVRQRTPEAQAVVMSGTLAPGVAPDFYSICTQLAHEAGALSVVDAQGTALREALKSRPGLAKPNRPELAATLGRELKDQPALLQAMRELHERGAERVLITSGKEPLLAFDGRQAWRITPPVIVPANPIGSGDAFTAGLVWSLLRGDNLGEASRWGCATGAANALTLLPGEADRAEIDRLAKETRVEQLAK